MPVFTVEYSWTIETTWTVYAESRDAAIAAANEDKAAQDEARADPTSDSGPSVWVSTALADRGLRSTVDAVARDGKMDHPEDDFDLRNELERERVEEHERVMMGRNLNLFESEDVRADGYGLRRERR